MSRKNWVTARSFPTEGAEHTLAQEIADYLYQFHECNIDYKLETTKTTVDVMVRKSVMDAAKAKM